MSERYSEKIVNRKISRYRHLQTIVYVYNTV